MPTESCGLIWALRTYAWPGLNDKASFCSETALACAAAAENEASPGAAPDPTFESVINDTNSVGSTPNLTLNDAHETGDTASGVAGHHHNTNERARAIHATRSKPKSYDSGGYT